MIEADTVGTLAAGAGPGAMPEGIMLPCKNRSSVVDVSSKTIAFKAFKYNKEIVPEGAICARFHWLMLLYMNTLD